MVKYNLYGENIKLEAGDKFEVDEKIAQSMADLGYAKYQKEEARKVEKKIFKKEVKTKPVKSKATVKKGKK